MPHTGTASFLTDGTGGYGRTDHRAIQGRNGLRADPKRPAGGIPGTAVAARRALADSEAASHNYAQREPRICAVPGSRASHASGPRGPTIRDIGDPCDTVVPKPWPARIARYPLPENIRAHNNDRLARYGTAFTLLRTRLRNTPMPSTSSSTTSPCWRNRSCSRPQPPPTVPDPSISPG